MCHRNELFLFWKTTFFAETVYGRDISDFIDPDRDSVSK